MFLMLIIFGFLPSVSELKLGEGDGWFANYNFSNNHAGDYGR
jgi:hypothetical protein